MLGEEIGGGEYSSLVTELTERLDQHVDLSLAESVPLSCKVIGIHFENFSKDWFDSDHCAFVFFENYQKVVSAAWREIFNFFSNREPWEDYDACIFSFKAGRCVATTHNGEIKLVDF